MTHRLEPPVCRDYLPCGEALERSRNEFDNVDADHHQANDDAGIAHFHGRSIYQPWGGHDILDAVDLSTCPATLSGTAQ